ANGRIRNAVHGRRKRRVIRIRTLLSLSVIPANGGSSPPLHENQPFRADASSPCGIINNKVGKFLPELREAGMRFVGRRGGENAFAYGIDAGCGFLGEDAMADGE